MIQNAVNKETVSDESLDFAMRVFLSYRFTALSSTLAADDERFGFQKADLAAKLPPGTKPTRMAAFKLQAANATTPVKKEP